MIEVDNITKSYGETRALRGVSFRINKGEIVGLLGPNGAGKSTAMKILTCFIPADSGRATVAGSDVFTDSLAVRRRIGYLPENTPLYTEMPVVEFLGFVGGMRGLGGSHLKKRIREVVGLAGLEGAVGKTIGELSKGYRQRVGLAQALIHEPDILILDEPTSGLDPNQIKEIRDLIREIGREKTVILSTHILPEVTATCDRAIIVSGGRVVASGTPDELTSRGRGGQHVTASLRGPRAEVESALRALPGVEELTVLDSQEGVVQVELRATKGAGLSERVFEAAVAKRWGLVELRQEREPLEQVFMDLTT